MKKYNFLFILILILNSCSADFLNGPRPLDAISDASFWTTKEDIEGATNMIYNKLHNGGQNASQMYVVTANFPTNDYFSNEDIDVWNIIDLNFLPGNGRINNEWFSSYAGILVANRVIDRGANMQIDENFRNQKIGEAKCLRAYFYLHLVRAYGDVPLIITEQTASSDPYPSRTPKKEVLDQMVKDLIDAANTLPDKWDDANIGRVTKGTALALLELTHLYREDWGAAIMAFEQLESLGVYKLLPNYMDAYRWNNENNSESILENQLADVQRMALWLQHMLGPRDATAEGGGMWGVYLPTQKLFDAMEPGDDRSKQFLTPGQSITLQNGYTYTMRGEQLSAKTNVLQIKYWMGRIPSGNAGFRNVMFLKYAETILYYAEALANAGRFVDAYTQINRIRTRAKLPAKAVVNNLSTCIDDIYKERRIENCFDLNSGWWDLTRTKKAKEFLKKEHNKDMQDHHYLFPLPQTELDMNKNLVQNPGY